MVLVGRVRWRSGRWQGAGGAAIPRFPAGRAVDNKGMRQQGDSPNRQEDDWWRQLYDEGAGGTAGAGGPAPDSVDEHFDTALTAMSPPPPPSPPAETLRLRRPVPPPPPPSWPRPTRTPPAEGDEAAPVPPGAAAPGAAPRVPVVRLPGRSEPPPQERAPDAPAPAAVPGEDGGGAVPPPAPEPGTASYGAAEEGQERRGTEPPPWDAWAARPMFPSPDDERAGEAAGTAPRPGPEAGEPRRWPVWSPRPGTPDGRPVRPRPEPEPRWEQPDEAPAAPEWSAAPPAPAEPWASAPPAGWPVPRFPEQQESPPAPGPDATFSPAEPWTSPAPPERGPYAPPRSPRVAPEQNPYRTPHAADPPSPAPHRPPTTTPAQAEPAPVAPPFRPDADEPAPPAAAVESPVPPAPHAAAPSQPHAGESVPRPAVSAEPVAGGSAAPRPGASAVSGPSAGPSPLGAASAEHAPPVTGAPARPDASRAEPRRSQPAAPSRQGAGETESYRSLADAFAPPARAVPPAPVPEPDPAPAPGAASPDRAGAPALRPAAAGGVGPDPAAGASEAPAAIEAAAARAELPAEGETVWGETAFGEGSVRWAPELPPGWVAAGEEEPSAAVVGGGPPTYAAEPTAWPEADPEGLDGLVPDTVLDGAQYAGLTLRTVSLRGDSARYRGQPRRDALLTARFGSGDEALLLVAMASGARAADDAHRAAQDAVRWIAGAVGRSRERLAGDLLAARRGALKSGLHRLTDRCSGRLRARGEDLGLEDGAYTAALRCLLLPVDPRCTIRLFFGVGDGGLFRVRDGAWQDLDTAPDDPNGSPFRFRATSARPGDALVMCSAGLAEPLRGEPELASLLAERWSGGRAPGLAGYLADVQTRVKGYADDRTAVTVWEA